MADIFKRISRIKFVLRSTSKITPIEDKMHSSQTTSVSHYWLNERNVESIYDIYRRDSFFDRFCDDLCEDILQYLPLKHKLRLECVSEQFQRTIFQRHYKLDIRISLKHKDQSFHSFKALLKKCPNITSIDLKGDNRNVHNYNRNKFNDVFQLIIENCNNLNEINVLNDISLNYSNFKEFHRKFGPKIKYLSYFREFIDLSRFPNIEKIRMGFGLGHSIILEIKLTKLKELDIVFNPGQEHLLQIFIDNFRTLTHLSVYFNSDDENAIYKSMKNISNLKHLIHLNFRVNFVIYTRPRYNNRICGLLISMANKCLNLKSIEFNYYTYDKNSDIKHLFSQLKAFPALKRLNLWLYFCKNNIDVNQLFSFELFKGLSNITHLKLCFGCTQTLKDSILTDIDINLPNLQYLEIIDVFYTTPKGVTQLAKILSRLSRLETLKLYFTSKVNLKPIENKIIQKCRKIKKIMIINSFDFILNRNNCLYDHNH